MMDVAEILQKLAPQFLALHQSLEEVVQEGNIGVDYEAVRDIRKLLDSHARALLVGTFLLHNMSEALKDLYFPPENKADGEDIRIKVRDRLESCLKTIA